MKQRVEQAYSVHVHVVVHGGPILYTVNLP